MGELGEVLPRGMLAEGFTFDGDRVPLLGPQGIFKPRLCELPLSITTAPNGPYLDAVGADGLIEYRYRGTDPSHPDNDGLRRAMASQTPLIYFVGIDPGRYAVVFPAFVVGDDRSALAFKVQADDLDLTSVGGELHVAIAEDQGDARRRYITTTVQRRLHQAAFRERVLRAYTGACALCHLRHTELLDAAHIDEDFDRAGRAADLEWACSVQAPPRRVRQRPAHRPARLSGRGSALDPGRVGRADAGRRTAAGSRAVDRLAAPTG